MTKASRVKKSIRHTHKKDLSIGVYEVTRHFGGHEEGGWWYNWFTHVTSIVLPLRYTKEDSERLLGLTIQHWEKQQDGDIYSVLGGVEYWCGFETKEGSEASTQRPYYC